MHVFGANLVFNRRAIWANHGRMNTLVAIHLWNGNKVFKATMNGLIERMQGAKRQIALFHRFHNDAEPIDIKCVGERLMLGAHLVIDPVNRLIASNHTGADIKFRKLCARFVQNLF